MDMAREEEGKVRVPIKERKRLTWELVKRMMVGRKA